MQSRPRIVLDTNALVSRLLLPDSIPGHAVRKAVEEGGILMSEATLFELADVLGREKFDVYVSIQDREEFLRKLGRIVEMITILHAVQDCRDVRDNQILEVAVNGQAQVIVNGMKNGDHLDDSSQHSQKFFSVLDTDIGIKFFPSQDIGQFE